MRDDYVNMPVNDGDIDGIYRYLGWHMNKAGLSSTCFHYWDSKFFACSGRIFS